MFGLGFGLPREREVAGDVEARTKMRVARFARMTHLQCDRAGEKKGKGVVQLPLSVFVGGSNSSGGAVAQPQDLRRLES